MPGVDVCLQVQAMSSSKASEYETISIVTPGDATPLMLVNIFRFWPEARITKKPPKVQ
jgi:hypothetical protein